MQEGDDGEKPNAHDQNSIGGHLAARGLLGVELKHCAGAAASGRSTAGGSPPAQARGSRCTPSGRAVAIGRHLVLALYKGNERLKH
uniref:Uncharacterized protein n=1 Tax=Oryza brachyantha TaxID=4533 RepID=J3NBS0_ORYBR